VIVVLLSRLFVQLFSDSVLRIRFEAEPETVLAEAGLGGCTVEDLADALPLAVAELPPAQAAYVVERCGAPESWTEQTATEVLCRVVQEPSATPSWVDTPITTDEPSMIDEPLEVGEETPTTSEPPAPVEEALPVCDPSAPAEEAPPVEEPPMAYEPPPLIDELRVDETPVDETPVDETPVDETPVDETPVDETPVDETPVEEASPTEAPPAPPVVAIPPGGAVLEPNDSDDTGFGEGAPPTAPDAGSEDFFGEPVQGDRTPLDPAEEGDAPAAADDLVGGTDFFDTTAPESGTDDGTGGLTPEEIAELNDIVNEANNAVIDNIGS
jgi:hypothetical protein